MSSEVGDAVMHIVDEVLTGMDWNDQNKVITEVITLLNKQRTSVLSEMQEKLNYYAAARFIDFEFADGESGPKVSRNYPGQ